MKVCAVLLFALVGLSVQSKEFSEFVAEYDSVIADIQRECVASVGVDPTLVQKVLQEGSFTSDRKLKCFMNCLHLKLKVIDEAGNVNQDMLRKVFGAGIADENTLETVFQKCKDIKHEDGCDTSHEIAKCFSATILETLGTNSQLRKK